jgi:carbon-monoxide dehydrogenase medium subunit
VKATEFFVNLLTTDLQPGEILREIRIAKPSGRFGQSYQKVPHPASGFAVVGIAAHLELNDDGSCKTAKMGVTGVGVKAYRAQEVEAALAGANLDDQTIASAAAHVCDGVDPNSDLYASGEYRCALAQVYTRRAIQAAKTQIK